MKTLRKYLISFVLLSFAGGLYLRWFQLTYFYRIQETFFSGIATTLISITALMIILCIIDSIFLKPFVSAITKIKNGESLSESEYQKAISSIKKIDTACVIGNAIGFVIGQVLASTLDIINGVVIAVPSKLAFIFFEAVLVGTCLSLYETTLLTRFMYKDYKLLKMHTTDRLKKEPSLSIQGKLILSTLATLMLMGVHCFCAAYQIILQDSGTPVANQMSEYLKSFFPVFLGTLIPCMGIIIILSYDIKLRLTQTSERIKDIGNKGDLSSRINVTSRDEIGQLTSCVNVLLKQLSELVQNIKNETKIATSSAVLLSNTANISSSALNEMKDSVQKVSAEGKRQGNLVNAASNEITHVTSNALEVEQQVSMQASAVQQASASINEMAANIESVADLAKKAETLSSNLRSTSSTGTTAIHSAVSAILEIRTASAEVQEIIKVIQKIASQTNLLSMNAAIEAAHAGTYGQGFAVVADEVRSLATSSNSSAKDIQNQIKEMTAKIDAGVESIQAAGSAFEEINAGIENTSNLVQTITAAMEEQRVGASETLRATESVVESINQIEGLSKQQREYAENASTSINQIVDAFKDITEALELNNKNSENLEKAIQEVATGIEKNTTAVQKMNKEIEVFKL